MDLSRIGPKSWDQSTAVRRTYEMQRWVSLRYPGHYRRLGCFFWRFVWFLVYFRRFQAVS
jgi:hypothetical protein